MTQLTEVNTLTHLFFFTVSFRSPTVRLLTDALNPLLENPGEKKTIEPLRLFTLKEGDEQVNLINEHSFTT